MFSERSLQRRTKYKLLNKKPNIGNFFLVFSQFSKINNSRTMMSFEVINPPLKSPDHALSNEIKKLGMSNKCKKL